IRLSHNEARSDLPGRKAPQQVRGQSRRIHIRGMQSPRYAAAALVLLRRARPRRPPHAAIRPGRPAPAMGPGTAATLASKCASRILPTLPSVVVISKNVKPLAVKLIGVSQWVSVPPAKYPRDDKSCDSKYPYSRHAKA